MRTTHLPNLSNRITATMVLNSKNLELTQAVLVCDNFNDEFQPIQSDQQLALLKVANCPLIEHSLTFLKANGIEQVIIFTSNLPKVKGYLEERKWIKPDEEIPFAIVRPSDTCTSLGDVMRDVFNSNLVKNDFVLLNGNVIGGNIPLLRYLKHHVERRKNDDKGSIMTMLYGRLDFEHRSRSKENESILVVNKQTQKMLFYETLANAKKKIGLQLELLRANPTLRIHFDLQDTHIALCSISVPQLFADNFDYYTKDDLVRGILVHEEIMMNTIYIQTLDEDAYAVKVNDAFSFDAVSRDIIERWSFPVVPDLQEDLCYHRHNIYKSDSVDLKIDSLLEQNLVIGRNTRIDSGARIRDSVIGDNCRLGKNVRINGCYLLDNVVVEDDCVLRHCILSSNVHVKRNCQVPEGCMLGANCVVGPNVTLKQCTLLQEKSEFDEELDTELVGAEGKGYVYKLDDEDDDEEEADEKRLLWGQPRKVVGDRLEDSDSSDENDSDDSDENADEDEDFEGQLGDEEFKGFYREVKDSLMRGVREKVESKNLILEINASKYVAFCSAMFLNFWFDF